MIAVRLRECTGAASLTVIRIVIVRMLFTVFDLNASQSQSTSAFTSKASDNAGSAAVKWNYNTSANTAVIERVPTPAPTLQ